MSLFKKNFFCKSCFFFFALVFVFFFLFIFCFFYFKKEWASAEMNFFLRNFEDAKGDKDDIGRLKGVSRFFSVSGVDWIAKSKLFFIMPKAIIDKKKRN
jgi:hypothetical protein